jgi:hypothetical protein
MLSSEERLQVLRRVPIFAGLSAAQLRALDQRLVALLVEKLVPLSLEMQRVLRWADTAISVVFLADKGCFQHPGRLLASSLWKNNEGYPKPECDFDPLFIATCCYRSSSALSHFWERRQTLD